MQKTWPHAGLNPGRPRASLMLYRYTHGCIYILLDTVLATDVNKYSLASARCQPIWRTKFGELGLF